MITEKVDGMPVVKDEEVVGVLQKLASLKFAGANHSMQQKFQKE